MAYEAWSVEWNMPVIVRDPFRRTANSSWGAAPGALTYLVSGGADTDYYVDGAVGRMLLGSVNVARTVTLPIAAAEVELTATIYNSVVPTGAGFEYHARLRFVDDNNFVDVRVFPSTANTVTCSVRQVVAGVETNVGFPTVAGATATSNLRVRLQVYGSGLRARVWPDTVDEPRTWTVEMSTTWSTVGDLQLRALLAAGNTNTEKIVIGWDDLEVVTPDRWVNITPYVDTSRGSPESGGSPFTIASGDTPEASADTGGMGLPLLNADQRFTPGNIVSPHYPNITPGSQIRVRETIGDRVFDRGHGYVQYPEIQAWTQSNEDSPRDQQITIPVVDRAAWLAQSRRFVGMLAEHIIYHGGPSLVAYWPMAEPEGPDVNAAIGGPWTLTATRQHNGFIATPTAGTPTITFGDTGIPLADDTSAVSFDPIKVTTPVVDYLDTMMLTGRRASPVTLGAGQVLTVVGWTRPSELLAGAVVFSVIELVRASPTTGSVSAYASVFINASGQLVGGANTPDWFGTVTGPPAPVDHSMPVAVRVGVSPDILELWVRGEVYTGSLTVTTATAQTFETLNVAERYPGAVNHGQVYLGNATDWTHDDFLAQYQMGLYGAERQTTGERIRTILTYAGVDPSELGRVDAGASLMQIARLAGREPMDLVAEAVETEQGEFYVAGDNRPVFADRVRLYNI